MAKLLGFGYPGGPIIDQLAPYGNPRAVKFTLAKMKGNELDFSFSGLKTAVLRWTEQHDLKEEIARRRQLKNPRMAEWLALTPQPTLDLLASFQHTVIEELLRRSISAAELVGAESVIVAGRRGIESRDCGRRRWNEADSTSTFHPRGSPLITQR